ncbi:hypothetical protein E2C01_008796 [Portunus trituberculatus]|uniref:Uncharacterized protein n=1 Tax=Portunus trituberculatus TaxID=210409 RepID=A0A5B7D2Z2_PORTR|nr:hypothetical protein [Portunus trituberculatus]
MVVVILQMVLVVLVVVVVVVVSVVVVVVVPAAAGHKLRQQAEGRGASQGHGLTGARQTDLIYTSLHFGPCPALHNGTGLMDRLD